MRAALSTIIRRFVNDRRGNIAVIFALACVPLITAVGCAVDYSRATQTRAKLQAAADAASVGSIAKASPAFKAAGTMTSDGSISVGVTDAQNIFDANRANQTGYTLNSVTPTVVKTGSTVTSTVAFNATMNTMFLGLIGKSALTLSGTSKATASMPLYIDFYLLLDNSPSMGVGATPTDVQTMVNNTSDKCAFACHDLKDKNNYYDLAKKLGVTTRIDVLRTATQSLMDTASVTQTYSNQFRMAIYDFGGSASTLGLRNLFSLSASLSSAKTAAGNIDLMSVNGQNENNDQDTAFTAIFPAINGEISSPGTGTPSSPLKYLFFVSDGVADESNTGCLKPLSGTTRCQSPLNAALCKTMKDRGVKIAVLYTTYLALPTNSWYMKWIAPFNTGPYGPSPNSEIAQNMQSCASSGLYFEVSPTQGISDAMNALFKKAVADARISG
ncbi:MULTISPECIES: TadE/TadG family type IV pilus assembly protein [unclassified Bradyrhizobium]|uniref:TadE/TadG family type IV pilus assembly protein n=1 Tax=unclassified Bradyrhizobium TaxID=2631580 RepID=UPI000379798E|nr:MULTISPECIES: TadE/TadG family type IV pilus assembly protein [unclassified Bradyrhizobium]MBB4259026.1 Flp pilus assembly protein TadG [Bradyrhizobium sp. CIR3A]MBB4382195.1 Flp pilus assembly protein TadG [Bradyrhizobium sp. SBR1B]MBB4398399.1 Flp pilus assembly protein TadG [Bradyrhizobium sp. ERR14]MBB4424481.1 Flp pilus assembly protein TadG [Bradyrhizobium sp. CIR48]NYG44352.1 Flp pilus assembly protein TadG [Bradyrhizobium sp. IAR9]